MDIYYNGTPNKYSYLKSFNLQFYHFLTSSTLTSTKIKSALKLIQDYPSFFKKKHTLIQIPQGHQ